MSRIELGKRTVSKSVVNIPAEVERWGFRREGKLNVEYDPEENAVVYTPSEESE